MRRLLVLLAIMLACVTGAMAGGFTTPAHASGANFFGGYSIPAHSGSLQSSRRGWRVKISRTDISWLAQAPGNNNFVTSWIGAEQLNSSNSATSDFIQIGIIKGNFAPASGCSGDTAGSVKMFWYRINQNGNPMACGFGSLISANEGHAFTVQRCSGSDWCVYQDGTLQHEFDASLGGGLPSTMNFGQAFSECGQGTSGDCANAAYSQEDTNFGGSGSNASPNLQMTDTGHDCGCATWQNVDAWSKSNDSGLFTKVDNMSFGSPWEVLLD